MTDNADKGQENGSCNVTACQRPGATWYNHSTRAWYCKGCRYRIEFDVVNLRHWREYMEPEVKHPMFECREMIDKRLAAPQPTVAVPEEPTGEMMDAVRCIVQWLQMGGRTQSDLVGHLKRRGKPIPKGCEDVDHAPPARLIAYWIYQGMVSARPAQSDTDQQSTTTA